MSRGGEKAGSNSGILGFFSSLGADRRAEEARQQQAVFDAQQERADFLENRPVLSLFDLIPGLSEFKDLRKGREGQENPFNVLNELFLNFNKQQQALPREIPSGLPKAQPPVAPTSGVGQGK